MAQLYNGLLTLIKSAVTDQKLQLPEGFSLEEAMTLIMDQHLAPLVCEGAVNCGLMKDPMFPELFRSSCQHLLASEQQGMALRMICREFDKAGIDYMQLKGCLLKRRYPKHEFRPMSDADILIRVDQYEKIRELLPGVGFRECQESDHEYVWHSQALHLELHKRLIPSYNQDYHAYFGDGWQLARPGKGCSHEMKPEDEYIYLFVHMAKHYRAGGIGCRHLVDLWIHDRAFPNKDRDYLNRELEKLQLLEFYNNICRTLEVWFEGREADDITDMITRFVFDNGDWGAQENYYLADAVRNRKIAGSATKGKLRSIMLMFFPAYGPMAMHYPVLKKAAWLLPLFWVVRWGELVFVRSKSVREKYADLKVVSEENVDAYQKSLETVGLDFRFHEDDQS